MVYIAGGAAALAAMLGGDVDVIATASAPTIIQANLRGSRLIMIGATANTIVSFFMVTPNIKTPDDLKGRTVGTTRLGSFNEFSIRLAMQKWGLQVPKDVAIIQMGGVPEIRAGMKAGVIVGGALSPPTALKARKEGYIVLTDISRIGVRYPQTTIAVSRDFLKSHRETLGRYYDGYD